MPMNRPTLPRPIELLAPARNAEIAIEALRHGADAVYMGASSHGARAAAGNSIDDLRRVADYAHQFGARLYATVNTIIYDDELDGVRRMIHELYRAGVDALIVQDMALLTMDIPPIALHASTQCDIRTPAKARFLAAAGFSQLVLPRELTLAETAEIHAAVPQCALEAFVHGALCVSYSGDCQAGCSTMGRSANRGECPQICRHKFDLTDAQGRVLISDRHLLSLRDLNRSARLGEMMEAGVSSFKIEGRLKDVAYVKNVTAAYRRLIDEIISANPERYRRSSVGISELTFTPDLNKSFNRGYTEYFTTAPRPEAKMASWATPKWVGEPVGTVTAVTPQMIRARLSEPIANGDGLGYFDQKGEFQGFRVNRAETDRLFPASRPAGLTAGTRLYRNHDRLRREQLEGPTAERFLPVNITLRTTARGIALDMAVTVDNPDRHRAQMSASAALDGAFEAARTPQAEARRGVITRLGDTPLRAAGVTDLCGDIFIPRSALAALRRQAAEALMRAIRSTHPFDCRRAEDKADAPKAPQRLTYHDNVANRQSEAFYRARGAGEIEPAMEVSRPNGERTVMTTRYCLRRESGRCLLTDRGREWPRELYLVSGPMRFRLAFDCRECRMRLIHND